MAYQRGSLRQCKRKEGMCWVLRFRVMSTDGRRVENVLPVGLVRDFPKEGDAWREVDKLGLLVRINNEDNGTRITFATLADHYIRADFSEDAVRPKTEKTTKNIEHLVRDYLIVRWGKEMAEDVKPLRFSAG